MLQRTSLSALLVGVLLLAALLPGHPAPIAAQGSGVKLLVVDDFNTDTITTFSQVAADWSTTLNVPGMVQQQGGVDALYQPLGELVFQIAEQIRPQLEPEIAVEIVAVERHDMGLLSSPDRIQKLLTWIEAGEVPDIPTIILQNYCGLGLEGQGFAVARKMGPITGAHGQMVVDTIEHLAATYGQPFDVIRVDTGGFSTALIARNIQFQIDQDLGAKYVVNMSFAIVPCNSVADLIAYETLLKSAGDLTEDMGALRSVFGQMQDYYSTVAVPGLHEGYFNDGVLDLVRQPNVLGIAAAGNSGRDFPFWPAAWPEVIAVSASADQEDLYSINGRDPDSNWGEVMMPGEWTSFAAPRLSYVMAWAWGSGGEICFGGVPAFSTQSYTDRVLRDIAADLCPPLPLP